MDLNTNKELSFQKENELPYILNLNGFNLECMLTENQYLYLKAPYAKFSNDFNTIFKMLENSTVPITVKYLCDQRKIFSLVVVPNETNCQWLSIVDSKWGKTELLQIVNLKQKEDSMLYFNVVSKDGEIVWSMANDSMKSSIRYEANLSQEKIILNKTYENTLTDLRLVPKIIDNNPEGHIEIKDGDNILLSFANKELDAVNYLFSTNTTMNSSGVANFEEVRISKLLVRS